MAKMWWWHCFYFCFESGQTAFK